MSIHGISSNRLQRSTIRYAWTQWTLCLALTAVLGPLLTVMPANAQYRSDDERHLRVMTYNVNEGTDFLQVQAATNESQFLVAVGETITQVRETNPPVRMHAIARQIFERGPALVSLEELDQWYSGPFDPATGQCGPVTLEFDMVQELMDALADQGAHYEVAVEGQQYAFPPTPGLILPSTFLCVQVVNHVAILARTDLDSSKFQWHNPQTAQYVSELLFPTPLGTLPLPRAWVSVDAQFHDRAFRFIGTHLESVVPEIREAQGAELRAGPANTYLPVILAMDSNSQAFPLPQDQTYLDFIAAGFKDSWADLFPLKPGLTCCQAELDNNPVSQLYQRIDLILTFGKAEARKIDRFNDQPSDRTPQGLWPSDHAGVFARVAIEDDYEDNH